MEKPMTPAALRRDLQRRGWSQSKAARMLGVSQHAIWSWLKGRSAVPTWASLSLNRIPITLAEETEGTK